MVIYENMNIDDIEQADDGAEATDVNGQAEADDLLASAEPLETVPDDSTPENQPAAGRPVLSPDGSRVAVLYPDQAGVLRLWILPTDGSAGAPLNLDLDLASNEAGPQWSPDGQQLAISAPHPADGRSAIWVVHVDTAFARLLVDHAGFDTNPIWSPDGAWIGFLSTRSGRTAASIVPADGLGSALQVGNAAAGLDDHSLTWARDSGRLAYAQRATDGEKVGSQIYTYDLATGATKQVTTRLCGRSQLAWAPDRNLIMHVADDAEWDQIAVVNADNSSGWNIAAEKGDKFDPVWSKDGQRVAYSRRIEGVVRVAERGTSTATAESIDPGEGEARWPQIMPDKRVLYVYSSPSVGPTIFLQEPKEDAERITIPLASEWTGGTSLTKPRYQQISIGDVTSGALIYQWAEQSGPIPAVVVLRDRPQDSRTMVFDALEQTMAANGFIVVTPTLPGTPGEGRKVATSLKDRVDSEGDLEDIVSLIGAVKELPGVDPLRVAIVGVGQGAALAISTIGSRPGLVKAIAVVDPVCDWGEEFDSTDDANRARMLSTYGLPAVARGVYAVRTPSTFAGIIDVPTLLMGTEGAPAGRSAQLDGLAGILRDLGHPFEQDVSIGESQWDAMTRVSAFIRNALLAVPATVVHTAEAVTADAV